MGQRERRLSTRGRLRVGDSGRQLAIGVLQRAMEKGQLSLDEFEDRVAIVLHAKIRGDLRPVLEDLEEYQLVRMNRRLWRSWLDWGPRREHEQKQIWLEV